SRSTQNRSKTIHRQRGRTPAQRSMAAAIPIHPTSIQARRLMTHLGTSFRLKPLLDLTALLTDLANVQSDENPKTPEPPPGLDSTRHAVSVTAFNVLPLSSFRPPPSSFIPHPSSHGFLPHPSSLIPRISPLSLRNSPHRIYRSPALP